MKYVDHIDEKEEMQIRREIFRAKKFWTPIILSQLLIAIASIFELNFSGLHNVISSCLTLLIIECIMVFLLYSQFIYNPMFLSLYRENNNIKFTKEEIVVARDAFKRLHKQNSQTYKFMDWIFNSLKNLVNKRKIK